MPHFGGVQSQHHPGQGPGHNVGPAAQRRLEAAAGHELCGPEGGGRPWLSGGGGR